MKNKVLWGSLAIMLISVEVYAGSGDLIVGGNLKVNAPGLYVYSGAAGTQAPFFWANGTTAAATYGTALNTGGRLNWGVDSSAGGALGSGTLPYASVIGSINFATPLQFMTNGTVRATIDGTGNVGIGLTNPAYKLDVAGDIAIYGVKISSDRRLKRNVEQIHDPLNKVLALNGLSYAWKTDEYKDRGFAEGRHYGVIAQDIEKVLPEVVSTAPDGMKSVAYTEIIPVLIEAIKEQQKEIEALKSKVAELAK